MLTDRDTGSGLRRPSAWATRRRGRWKSHWARAAAGAFGDAGYPRQRLSSAAYVSATRSETAKAPHARRSPLADQAVGDLLDPIAHRLEGDGTAAVSQDGPGRHVRTIALPIRVPMPTTIPT